jgi:hypothetical protein
MKIMCKKFAMLTVLLAVALGGMLSKPASAQGGDDEDPPGRVARLGYLQGSVSFQPAGESDWVGAVPNRPMTTGDQLWTDQDSRAEVQLGSSVIRLSSNTGFSFLNLDDRTVQIQLTSGAISVTVRRLHEDDDYEIDTPNQAFNIFQPGHYRVEVGANGDATYVTVREGDGESTGAGQSYEIRGGQSATLSGTDQLYADVEPLYDEDDFDNWCQERDRRFDYSRSAHYLSPEVVGFEDLDDNGDWRDDPAYGHIWFPNRVDPGWAPYHVGHWAWISPWGWTWVDDNPWGYAPFHYGRWVNVYGRWGWVAGPPAEAPVYAPALVVFIGGGPGGFGGNVGWFPLGPREVFVPSYHVSEAYVNRVNISSTTVNVTQVTNVYRTTIINNNTTNITNITYANRNVQGAVMVVPQHAFTSAQPVAAARVQVSAKEIASAPMSARVAVAPTRESVMGLHAATAGHVSAPPAAVAARQVVAKKTPPPPPVPFAKQQQALAAHPGEPIARRQMAALRPPAAARPAVKVAPPAKKATPTVGHPPANASPRPGQPTNRPGNPPPAGKPRPAAPAPAPAQPNRPAPAPANRPAPAPAEPNRPAPAPPSRPAPVPENRPPAPQPNRPAPTPPPSRPEAAPNRPENRPPAAETNRPAPKPAEPAPRPAAPAERPQQQRTPPPAAKPAAPPQKPKPMTPEEKKRQEEEKKKQ